MNNNKTRTVARFRRGLASAVLVATLATQVAPLATVSAEVINHATPVGTQYKTLDSGQYRIDINPQLGKGSLGDEGFTTQGGSYTVEQIAQYTRDGQRNQVSGTPRTVVLTKDGINAINFDSDGEYKITPAERIPGFLKDLGSTTERQAGEDDKTVGALGHYIYAFPLITDGVPSEGQTVDFQPKLREARQDLTVQKVGDDQTSVLRGVTFTVYKTFDAQTGDTDLVKLGSETTDEEGKVTFPNLIEGSYYFVEEGAVPARYLPDHRKIEFDVEVGEDQETVSINFTDETDNYGNNNNIRGVVHGDGYTRYNYIDPSQNKTQTYQSLWSDYVGGGYAVNQTNSTKEGATGADNGIVYVNTNGIVEFSSSVDIPKNFADFDNFTVVDTLDDKLTLDTSSIELRIMEGDTGVIGNVLTTANGALNASGQTITLDATNVAVRSLLEAEGVDYVVLTYKASVDTDEITENVEFDRLTNTQTLTSDDTLTDGVNTPKTTIHETNVRVREGQLVVDKVANDGTDKKLAGAEFQLYVPAVGNEVAEVTSHNKGWVKATNPRGDKANYFGSTDANGALTFENLPYGDYLLVETKAPAGYRINNNHQLIEIRDDNGDLTFVDGVGNTVTQEVTNMRQNQIFPGTGTTGNIITIAVLAVAGGALAYVTVKKKNVDDTEEVASEEA